MSKIGTQVSLRRFRISGRKMSLRHPRQMLAGFAKDARGRLIKPITSGSTMKVLSLLASIIIRSLGREDESQSRAH